MLNKLSSLIRARQSWLASRLSRPVGRKTRRQTLSLVTTQSDDDSATADTVDEVSFVAEPQRGRYVRLCQTPQICRCCCYRPVQAEVHDGPCCPSRFGEGIGLLLLGAAVGDSEWQGRRGEADLEEQVRRIGPLERQIREKVLAYYCSVEQRWPCRPRKQASQPMKKKERTSHEETEGKTMRRYWLIIVPHSSVLERVHETS